VTIRGVDWLVVGGGSTIGVAILAGCVAAAEHGPPFWSVRLGLITLVGASAYVLDEPAAAAVDAVPTTRRRRTGVRTTAAALPLAVWAAGVLALEQRNPVTPAGALLVEGAGAVATAVAAAALVRWAGRNEPGEVVATTAGAVILGLVIFDPPQSVPLFPVDHGWAASTRLWSGIAVAAIAVVVAASTDRYRITERNVPGPPVRRVRETR
jgi:hypothetical protein